MLRELSQLLVELSDGIAGIEARGVTLTNVDMTLPLDVRVILRNGGCVLLADVPRTRDVNEWSVTPSKLHLSWSAAGATKP